MLKSDLFPIMNICRLQMQSFLSGDCLHISIFYISCKHYLFYDISSSLPVHFRKVEGKTSLSLCDFHCFCHVPLSFPVKTSSN